MLKAHAQRCEVAGAQRAALSATAGFVGSQSGFAGVLAALPPPAAAPTDEDGLALWKAVDEGDVEGLTLLLSRLGPNSPLVNSQLQLGTPALHWAARRGAVAVVQTLLDFGADVAVKDARREKVEGALLSWTFDGSTALHWACFFGNDETVDLLIDRGSDLCATDKVGGTPLMAAAYSGHKRVCERLIARGVDVHQTDRRGETAMHSAAERGHVEVCELLHSKGLSATLASRLGTTPFHSAAERGHLPLCKWFVSIGVDAHTTDTFGRSPLHCAAERGQLAICQWLVDECNLSISSTTRFGTTALHSAAEKGRLELCHWLVQKGAPVHVADMDGKTPLHSAAMKGHLNVIQWFVDAGGAARVACWRPTVVRALLGALDVEGKTFMHWLMEKDDLHGGVGNLVRSHRSLADLSDRVGRLPTQVGTKSCMAAVVKALLLYGRYKVKHGEPRHQSETSVVVYASEIQALRDARSGALKEVKRKLVLKFLRRKEHFCRELEARAALERRLRHGRASATALERFPQPVLPLLGVHGSDGVTLHPGCTHCPDLSAADLLSDARALMNDFSSVDGESFLKEGAWCVVMEREEATLRMAIHNEMLGPPGWDRVREAAGQLGECLAALHKAGIVHADFKPANAVRIIVGSETCGTVEWRLIDLSSAVFVRGDDGSHDPPASPSTPSTPASPAAPSAHGSAPGAAGIRGQKFSTAYCPPEFFELGSDGECQFIGERAAHFLTESFDVWAFGVVLYRLCHARGEPLWKEDRGDNISDTDRGEVFRWNNHIKEHKLEGVWGKHNEDDARAKLARELLDQILQRDPGVRPSMAEVLQHPFLKDPAKER